MPATDEITTEEGSNIDAVESVRNLYNSDGTYAIPDAIEEPGTMGFSPIMTVLQRRAAIATGGVAGTDSTFRDDNAQEYYINLLLRSIIGEDGAIIGDFTDILPIELQYMRQVLGIEPGGSVEEVIDEFDEGPGPDGTGDEGDDGVGDIDTGIDDPIITPGPGPTIDNEGGDGGPGGDPDNTSGTASVNDPLSETDQEILGLLGMIPGFGPATGFTSVMDMLGFYGVQGPTTPQVGTPAFKSVVDATAVAGLLGDEDFMSTVDEDIAANPDIFGGANVDAPGPIGADLGTIGDALADDTAAGDEGFGGEGDDSSGAGGGDVGSEAGGAGVSDAGVDSGYGDDPDPN